MPWSTPTLAALRATNRAYIEGRLGVPLVPNSYGRVLADANGGNAHLALQYLDCLSLQLLPDTAETVFLDKWANIFLVNSDGTLGRKAATLASGMITVTGIAGTIYPSGSQLAGPTASAVGYQTTAAITIGSGASPVPVRALDAGAAGNLDPGTLLSVSAGLSGLNAQSATVVTMSGGADAETDDELRVRVLARIRQPPMGGDADDWVNWSLSVPGVTRAWCSPNEMGIGTVTVRIMCDDLRATTDPTTDGFPLAQDLAAVQTYLNTVRPVTIKEFWVEAPIPQLINGAITNLVGDSVSLRAAVNASISAMLSARAKPAFAFNGVAQPATTIPAAWVSEAIFAAVNGVAFDLTMPDAVMPGPGYLAVLGAFT